jgi:cytoskeletal protein CcmA (bactofilin family)
MFERKSSKPAEPERVEQPAAAPAKPVAEAPPKPMTQGANAMIGAKVKINGDIHSSEDLLIEGEVSGTVTLAENELVIGNSGKVQANIEAKTIRIEGDVQGDIIGRERVVITASGNVQGNVTAPRVMLEDGGRFKGSIDMGNSPGKKSEPVARPQFDAGTSKPDVQSVDKTA